MDLVTLPQINDFKSTYMRLISTGYTESRALRELEVDFIDFIELVAKDEKFREGIEDARKQRAEIWVGKIIQSVNEPRMIQLDDGTEVERIPGKDETAHRKLEFEKLKFLAKADNPDRYGDASGKNNKVEINLNEFRLLTPQESIKVLNNDPFNKMAVIDVTPTDGET
jgi:hypothetical protein